MDSTVTLVSVLINVLLLCVPPDKSVRKVNVNLKLTSVLLKMLLTFNIALIQGQLRLNALILFILELQIQFSVASWQMVQGETLLVNVRLA